MKIILLLVVIILVGCAPAKPTIQVGKGLILMPDRKGILTIMIDANYIQLKKPMPSLAPN